jgi:tRNA threonylcarbamoyladenosine biosynthesis protein TsaE
MVRSVITRSVEETIAVGEQLGMLLEKGDFIALTGDLGSGKTHFARGIAAGLAVDPSIPITSPTYTLMNVYSGRVPLYHFDLYRLHGGQECIDLGFEEYFYGNGVCVVEWAERLKEELPEERLEILFTHADDERRSLMFTPSGERALYLIQDLFADENKKMF